MFYCTSATPHHYCCGILGRLVEAQHYRTENTLDLGLKFPRDRMGVLLCGVERLVVTVYKWYVRMNVARIYLCDSETLGLSFCDRERSPLIVPLSRIGVY